MTVREKIMQGRTCLGIELGSTRIKAVLTDDTFLPIAAGACGWENKFENGLWTYSLDDIHKGIQACFSDLARDVSEKYGVSLTTLGAMGISAMMHGYMAFDENDNLLVPFRTWRNTSTAQASQELTELFGFNIPMRWSVAHYYQAVLNKEPHVPKIKYITTLAGYIHYRLTGIRAVGVGEASGMFPVKNGDYDRQMTEKLDRLLEAKGVCTRITDILPRVMTAGEAGAVLTQAGARFLAPDGSLSAGIPLCPPEGDAGTGMAATNSVRPGTGNISAGTSVFSMLVLKDPLKGYYPEIDMVTTPDGADVAMVHCNNCCSELDAWVKLFGEFAALSGHPVQTGELYAMLYKNALSADKDCGGITAYNYLSGEPVTGVEEGSPMYFRTPDSTVTLGGFFRAELYASVAALKLGMDILFQKEAASADKFTGHGGLFKVEGVAQQILADSLNTPVSVMKTAGEGGAWGMALLAAYMLYGKGRSLADFLDEEVFSDMEKTELYPCSDGTKGFISFMERYKKGLRFYKK